MPVATAETIASDIEVSPNNPCPFLRALVAQGLVGGGTVALGELVRVIRGVAITGEGAPQLPAALIYSVALVANGLSPAQLARNAAHGATLDALRGGPLDKRGSGSRILDVQARVQPAELERLDEFAGDKVDKQGGRERGLDRDDIKRMMDANFARAAGHRRRIDRVLMEGEWPILLHVLGKDGADGRYLSLTDVRRLFADRRFPARMADRLPAPPLR